MTKKDYQNCPQYKKILDLIRKGIKLKTETLSTSSRDTTVPIRELASIAEEISKEICKLGIWISNDYVKEIRDGEIGTINPEDPRVKILSDSDFSSMDSFTLIKANACGLFNPQIFLTNLIRRKIQFLKESFILPGSFDNQKQPDRGGHNSPRDYCTWEKTEEAGESNNSKGVFIDLIKTMEEKIEGIRDENAPMDNKSFNKVMEGVGFIQLNFFPGLFHAKSHDILIKKWMEYNEPIIKKLLEFYSPDIIIGTGKNRDESKNLNKSILELLKTISTPTNPYRATSGSWYYDLVLFANKMIFIQAYHPAFRNKDVQYDLMKKSGRIIASIS